MSSVSGGGDRPQTLTRAERNDLIHIVKNRARRAKQQAAQREAVLRVEIEELLTLTFEAEDQAWRDAVVAADQIVQKANEHIAAMVLTQFGIPAEHAPRVDIGWLSRSPEFTDRQRRAELRKLADTRLKALTATAVTMIEEQADETQEKLLTSTWETEQARELLDALPTVEALMPPLTLDQLGVTPWQPPGDAAVELLAAPTAASARRKKILRAVAVNPKASHRQIAQLTGLDHKTVAKYRREGGELPAADGDSPPRTSRDE